MEINERRVEDVVVLDVNGNITLGTGDVRLREAVMAALGSGVNKILLNLEKVKNIDSAGIGELMATRTRVMNRGGELKLLKLSPKVGGVLQATQLIGILEIFDNEREALDSFR